jgi:hypothetical protein
MNMALMIKPYLEKNDLNFKSISYDKKWFKIQYLRHLMFKNYKITSKKFDSSRAFQQYQEFMTQFF